MNGIVKRGTVSPLLWAMALAALLLGVAYGTAGSRAHAQEIPGLGSDIVLEECANVDLVVLESSADYTSVFWSAGGSLGVTSKQAGEVIHLGEIGPGVLKLGIYVNDTGNTFWTGDGSDNPDLIPHAIYSGNTVGFEDILNGGDFDYNDAELAISFGECQPPPVLLTVGVDPASTGFGIVTGEGLYPLGSTAHPFASAGGGSYLVGWGGDCSGTADASSVLMDANKHCIARFDAIVEPTPSPTPEPTPEPPVVQGAEIGIDNTLASGNPAHVGDVVLFRVDVSLANVPAENTAEVYYTYNAADLEYVGAAWGDIALDECSLLEAGKVYCDFGNVTEGFPIMLQFNALQVANHSTTGATLGADFDGAGPEGVVTAGPANADVNIIDVAGVQLPPLGDGSVATTASNGFSFQLVVLLGAVAVSALALVAARLRTGSRS